MKTPDDSIRERVSHLHDETSAEIDRRILNDVSAVMDRKLDARRASPEPFFRTWLLKTARSGWFRLASVTVLILVAVLPFLLLNSSTTRAYAVQETLDAVGRLKTVHMAGELYQGKFECWLQYDNSSDEPSWLWLVIPRIPNLQRICTPDMSFTFNPRTKALYQCRRDERKQPWIIRFRSFFKDALENSPHQEAVTIGRETDPETARELIAVHLKSPSREQKVLVDPATKLPVKFVTLRDEAPELSMQRGIAIRNLDWIRYNEPIPKGLFDVANGATVVTEEPDVLATPENGQDASGMPREDACRALVQRMGKAMIEGDIAGIRQCAPFFWVVPDETFAKSRAAVEQTGRVPVEFTVEGGAHQEGEHWFLPCAVKNRDGSREESTAMIKFYRFGDVERCMVIGSKEKGVYD